jgi:hypothetical protein
VLFRAVYGLDYEESNTKRRVRVVYSKCIERAMTLSDARSLTPNLDIYVNEAQSQRKKDKSSDVRVVTKHLNGAVCQWRLTFDDSTFSVINGLHYLSRSTGHQAQITSAVCHPSLPLMISTSHQHKPVSSEIIVWRISAVGPLGKCGGLEELARVISFKPNAFTNITWIPTLLPR